MAQQSKFIKIVQWVVVIVTAVGLVASLLFIGPIAQVPQPAPTPQDIPVSSFQGPTQAPSAKGPDAPPSQQGPTGPPPQY